MTRVKTAQALTSQCQIPVAPARWLPDTTSEDTSSASSTTPKPCTIRCLPRHAARRLPGRQRWFIPVTARLTSSFCIRRAAFAYASYNASNGDNFVNPELYELHRPSVGRSRRQPLRRQAGASSDSCRDDNLPSALLDEFWTAICYCTVTNAVVQNFVGMKHCQIV